MRNLYILCLIALVGIVASVAFAEQITLSTYYPAPYGVYKEMRANKMVIGEPDSSIIPAPDTDGLITFDGLSNAEETFFTANDNRDGTLYYNSDEHKFKYYNGSATTWQDIGGGGFWTDSDDDIYNTNSGNVGIGTTEPTYELDVVGDIKVSDPNGATLRIIGGTDSITEDAKLYLGDEASDIDARICLEGGNGKLTIGVESCATCCDWERHLILSKPGRVGIGTSPMNKLDIEGAVAVGANYSGTNWAPSNGMIIEGNVGIGTEAPDYKLDVAGNMGVDQYIYHNDDDDTYLEFVQGDLINLSAGGKRVFTAKEDSALSLLRINPDSGNFDILVGPGGAEYLFIGGSQGIYEGRVGIGTTSPASRLDLGGGCMTGSICSDSRVKKNIMPLPEDSSFLAKVMKLQGASYEWKNLEDENRYYGLIAQDVEKVIPEVVMTSKLDGNLKGFLSIGLDAVLVEAIKELKAENEALKARIEALEAKLK